MGQTLILGTFDAEKFWRPQNYSKLPEIKDKHALQVVACMDELLFVLSEDNDLLVTRYAMNSVLKGYLRSIGFSFHSNEKSIGGADSIESCIFELLDGEHDNPEVVGLLRDAIRINPYAVLPWTRNLANRFNLEFNFPSVEHVIKVNSKLYSHEVSKELNIKPYGTIAYKSEDIRRIGMPMIGAGGFLIKDIFGVSGKGNMLITSENVMNRVLKHIANQEDAGMETCFLIEPFLEKEQDFSCQIHLDKEGRFTVSSVQRIINNGFSYLGSMAAEEHFIELLEQNGYFNTINDVVSCLNKDSYFGEICIDSMILKTGEIVPLVEINARKSMGLINSYIDKFLGRFSLMGFFFFLSLGYKGYLQLEDILQQMKDLDILFSPSTPEGVIPLSSNTLFINRDLDPEPQPDSLYKGRLYFSVVSHSQDTRRLLMEKVRGVLQSMGVTIYN